MHNNIVLIHVKSEMHWLTAARMGAPIRRRTYPRMCFHLKYFTLRKYRKYKPKPQLS